MHRNVCICIGFKRSLVESVGSSKVFFKMATTADFGRYVTCAGTLGFRLMLTQLSRGCQCHIDCTYRGRCLQAIDEVTCAVVQACSPGKKAIIGMLKVVKSI